MDRQKTRWDELSMHEKAKYIKLALDNGVSDLNMVRDSFNVYAGGGNIHIKPENKGRFTELKERTGKSSTWYKEHGTPAQKKMAVFALNARKWNHKHDGTESDSKLHLNDNGGYLQNLTSKPFSYKPIPSVRYDFGGFLRNLFGLNDEINNKTDLIDMNELAKTINKEIANALADVLG